MTLAQALLFWLDDPKFVIGSAILALLVMMIVGSSRQKRELSRAQDKVCGACGSGHPPFAVFCRKCGKKL